MYWGKKRALRVVHGTHSDRETLALYRPFNEAPRWTNEETLK